MNKAIERHFILGALSLLGLCLAFFNIGFVVVGLIGFIGVVVNIFYAVRKFGQKAKKTFL